MVQKRSPLLSRECFTSDPLHHHRHPRQDDEHEQRLAAARSSSSTALSQQSHHSALLSVRGGADAVDDSQQSLVLSKLQNILQSLLQVLERNLPLLASLLKMLLTTIENITGIVLLPKKQKHIKTKGKKKKKHIKSTQQQQQDDDKETVVVSKKHNKSSSSKHLTQKLSNKSPNYRIQKELKEFLQNPPPNLKVKVGSNIRVWIVEMKGPGIYEGETFRLRIQFPPSYPTVPPSVYFLPPTPLHEHVYTNGDICLSLLGKGWQPQMTAQSIAVSILSILASAQTKSLPMDNARHSQNKPGQYQKDWVYHDDNC